MARRNDITAPCDPAAPAAAANARQKAPVAAAPFDGSGNFVLYDGECPVCRSYMALAQLRRLRPDFKVLDARSEPGLVAALRTAGHEINDSILVRLGPRVYEGSGATRLIAELGSDNPLTRRLALAAIAGGPFGSALYPWLRATRNLLLRLMGKPLIS